MRKDLKLALDQIKLMRDYFEKIMDELDFGVEMRPVVLCQYRDEFIRKYARLLEEGE